MPKGQVTEEELATGLRGMGGLSALTPTKRDSPFRDSRAEPKTIELGAQAPPARIASTQAPLPKEEPPATKEPTPTRKKTQSEKSARVERPKALQRKADIYSERVTLQMSPEMRDEVDSLARDLQRLKRSKEERITANTVMRVAIRRLLDEFELPREDEVNSEEELYKLVRNRSRE